MEAEIAAALLVALLVGVAAAFYWQERRTFDDGVAVYGVEDSLEYVTARLSPETRARIDARDVRRILEWDLLYLQDARVREHPDEPVVVGGVEAAAFAQDRAYDAGYVYEPDVILEILGLRAAYLAELGVVGERVDADPGDVT